jgi:SOS-response transcriptional repressor LexA
MANKTSEGRERRVEILDYLRQYRDTNGYLPTRDQALADLGISVGVFQHHLQSLVDQGYVKYQKGSLRTLTFTRKKREFLV